MRRTKRYNSGRRKGDAEQTEADKRFDDNKALFAAIRGANHLVLYEGLPHQTFEAEELEKERRRKETLTLHDYPFYVAPLDVSAEDAANLEALLGDEQSFRQWRGEKKCGGFHPDYLAEWRSAEATYRFLICFGCQEVKVYGPNRSLRCDIRDGCASSCRRYSSGTARTARSSAGRKASPNRALQPTGPMEIDSVGESLLGRPGN